MIRLGSVNIPEPKKLFSYYIHFRRTNRVAYSPYPELYNNVCNNCRAVLLIDCMSTEMHHEFYHEDDLLKDTIELCSLCHKRYDKERRQRNIHPPVKIDKVKHSRKKDLIIGLAQHYERLHKMGKYEEPISHICGTISSQARVLNVSPQMIRLVLPAKYKQTEFKNK